jgi:uncharacterized membrane protein YphA (DoxX/SURF4 family)
MLGVGALMSDSNVVLAARIVLGGVFGLAGVGKLANHPAFLLIVRSYKWLPEAMVRPLSWFVPVAEIVLAALLLSGTQVAWAAIGAAGLLLGFSLAISTNLLRGHRDTSCGCCGNSSHAAIGWHLVLRNFGLVGLAAIGGGLTPYVVYVAFGSGVLLILPAAAVGLKRTGNVIRTGSSPI